MSDFYLCDRCAQVLDVDHRNTCACWPHGREHRKLVMHDYHGRDEIRYKDPTEVCKDFEPRTE